MTSHASAQPARSTGCRQRQRGQVTSSPAIARADTNGPFDAGVNRYYRTLFSASDTRARL